VTVEHRPIPPWARRQEIRIGAVIAVALAIGFVVWLVAIRGGGSSKAKITTIAPTAATPERMRAVAKGRPPDLLGRPRGKYDLRADGDLERAHLCALPPARHPGEHPEREIHDRRHVSGAGRVQSAQRAGTERRRVVVPRTARRVRRVRKG